MQTRWLQLILVFPILAAVSGSSGYVYGNHWRETAYIAPAETVLGVPTSYILPSSYIVPSAYVATSYAPTASVLEMSYSPTIYATAYTAPTYSVSPSAYVVPSYYRATSYLAARRLARRSAYLVPSTYYAPTTYVANGYVPTVYTPTSYYPTVYDYPVVATSYSSSSPCDVPCDTGVATPSYTYSAAPAPTPPASYPSAATPGNGKGIPSVVESTPVAQEPSYPSSEPYRPSPARSSAVPAREPVPSAVPSTDSGSPLPPARPTRPAPVSSPDPAGDMLLPPQSIPQENRSTAPPTSSSEISPPSAPSPSELGPAPAPEETVRRKAQKPVLSAPLRFSSNILEGRVVSSDSGVAEEGVQVTISNRMRAFADRTLTTDAYGRYAVRLPDGDWTVKVTMPSGRSYPVSQITISGGQITDDLGRDVPMLTIKR